MDLGLKDKVVVVTGGSRGIGLATAKAFLEEGAKLAICSLDEELEEVTAELEKLGSVYSERLDMSNSEKVYKFAENVYQKFGSIDCWVNNVGSVGYKKGEEYDDEEIDFMTGVCFKSVIFGSQAAYRYMKKNKSGVIVNVSSLAARCSSAGRSTLYGPLKSAINNLTNTFAGEYCADGIRVVCIMPGFTITPLTKTKISKEELEKNANATLLRRMAEPEEIARPIVFLASKAASYMTATTIEVAGGRSMTLNPTFAYDKLNK